MDGIKAKDHRGGSEDEWKTNKDFNETGCLMCKNEDWSWHEVLHHDCGLKEIGESISDLCEVHRIKAMKDLMGDTLNHEDKPQ